LASQKFNGFSFSLSLPSKTLEIFGSFKTGVTLLQIANAVIKSLKLFAGSLFLFLLVLMILIFA
jgi:hypothetical protein